jgi:hypothetical protein
VHEKNIPFHHQIIGCCCITGKLVKFGKASDGNKRFRCTTCGKTSVVKKSVVNFFDFVSFAQYVTHKENLFWSFHESESFEALSKDLEKLTNLILDSLLWGYSRPIAILIHSQL